LPTAKCLVEDNKIQAPSRFYSRGGWKGLADVA
jgi:hypothetical protein